MPIVLVIIASVLPMHRFLIDLVETVGRPKCQGRLMFSYSLEMTYLPTLVGLLCLLGKITLDCTQ